MMADMLAMVIEVFRENLWATLVLGAALGIAVYAYIAKIIELNRESNWQDNMPDDYWADVWDKPDGRNKHDKRRT